MRSPRCLLIKATSGLKCHPSLTYHHLLQDSCDISHRCVPAQPGCPCPLDPQNQQIWPCQLCGPLKEPHWSDNTAINCQVFWIRLFCILQDVNLGTQLAHSPLTVCSFNMGLYLALEVCVCSRKQWQYLLGTAKQSGKNRKDRKQRKSKTSLKVRENTLTASPWALVGRTVLTQNQRRVPPAPRSLPNF